MKRFAKTTGIWILLLLASLATGADDTKPAPTDAALAAARQYYLLGEYGKAEHEYKELLKVDAKLDQAQAGLTRVLLRQEKLDEALDRVNAALDAQPNSATLLAAKGDVQVRRGETAEAELTYLAALKLDAREAHAHLGLGRLYGAYSMRRRAYDHIQKAHEIAPNDLEVEGAWVGALPPEQRLEALQAFFAAHTEYQAEAKQSVAQLDYFKMLVDSASHSCKLVSKAEKTDTKLDPVTAPGARRNRGVGLSAKLNDQDLLLMVDTGASGIMINRPLAEKLKLTRIGEIPVRGFGDQGAQMGYTAVADHIQVGDLEFHDCVVRVADMDIRLNRRLVTPGVLISSGFDGVIGTDVFESYLVDIDLAAMRLRLAPLPKRPDEAVAPTALRSDAEDEAQDEGGLGATDQGSIGSESPSPKGEVAVPKDRYIAPEMANWTKVLHIGHELLVPTSVNDSKPLLFLLDTGSVENKLSLRAGRQVSKVYYEEHLRAGGLSGPVNKVYTSKSATLRFGRLEEKDKNIVTFDLGKMSSWSGVEVSGILAYEALMLLDVKLDYRDGLANFEYEASKQQK